MLPSSPTGAPLDISGVMNLRNILEVEEQMQQITLEITLRLSVSFLFANLSCHVMSCHVSSCSGFSGKTPAWG